MTNTFNTLLSRDMTIVASRSEYPAIFERLALSDGLSPACELYHSCTYKERSFVPRPPWRQPNIIESENLFSDGRHNHSAGASIRLMRMPGDLLYALQGVRIAAQMGFSAAVQRYAQTDHYACSIATAKQHLSRVTGLSADTFDSPKITVKAAGLPTTTSEPSSKLVGLHIDSWLPRSLSERQWSPYRLAVNIGASDRSFLMINLTTASLCSRVKEAGYLVDTSATGTHELRTAFMELFPHYPVLRICMRPGDAYVAPTENFIHDGSSQGGHYPDLLLTIRHNDLSSLVS